MEAKAVANPECGSAGKQGSVGGNAIFCYCENNAMTQIRQATKNVCPPRNPLYVRVEPRNIRLPVRRCHPQVTVPYFPSHCRAGPRSLQIHSLIRFSALDTTITMLADLSKATTVYLTPILMLTTLFLILFAYLAPSAMLAGQVAFLTVTPSTFLTQPGSNQQVDGPTMFAGLLGQWISQSPSANPDFVAGSCSKPSNAAPLYCVSPSVSPTYSKYVQRPDVLPSISFHRYVCIYCQHPELRSGRTSSSHPGVPGSCIGILCCFLHHVHCNIIPTPDGQSRRRLGETYGAKGVSLDWYLLVFGWYVLSTTRTPTVINWLNSFRTRILPYHPHVLWKGGR